MRKGTKAFLHTHQRDALKIMPTSNMLTLPHLVMRHSTVCFSTVKPMQSAITRWHLPQQKVCHFSHNHLYPRNHPSFEKPALPRGTLMSDDTSYPSDVPKQPQTSHKVIVGRCQHDDKSANEDRRLSPNNLDGQVHSLQVVTKQACKTSASTHSDLTAASQTITRPTLTAASHL